MLLFILSNTVLSLLAVIYNRLDNTTIHSKLFLSSFAMLCWVIPFVHIRNLFPKNLTIDIDWIAPQTFDAIIVEASKSTSSISTLSFSDVFFIACLIGIAISIFQLHHHSNWIKKLRASSDNIPVITHKGIPVFTSNLINSAVLIGFRKPSIWINPRLFYSPHRSVILAHESVHKSYMDNYSLLVIALLRNLYWWNPVVRVLAKDLIEHIEARCDYNASSSFPNNQYQTLLAELMHSTKSDLSINFSSAVISKNPNIRRLQYLSEENKMNRASKFYFATFITLTILVLALPVSTLRALAEPTSKSYASDKRFSMDFDVIPISMASKFISEVFKLDGVDIDSTIRKTVFTNFKFENTDLDELSDKTNINWDIENNTLKLTPRAGVVTTQFFSESERAIVSAPEVKSDNSKNEASEFGALLELKIIRKLTVKDSKNIKTVDMTVWTHFNKASTIKIDDAWEATFQIKELDNKVLLALNIFDLSPKRNLLASPRLFTTYRQKATVEWGGTGQTKGEIWTLEVTPSRSANPNSQ